MRRRETAVLCHRSRSLRSTCRRPSATTGMSSRHPKVAGLPSLAAAPAVELATDGSTNSFKLHSASQFCRLDVRHTRLLRAEHHTIGWSLSRMAICGVTGYSRNGQAMVFGWKRCPTENQTETVGCEHRSPVSGKEALERGN
jgi:hypothetical protein